MCRAPPSPRPRPGPGGPVPCDLRPERGVSGEGARVGVEVGTGRLQGEASLSRLWERGRLPPQGPEWALGLGSCPGGPPGPQANGSVRPLRGPGWSFRGRGCPRSGRGAGAGPPVNTEPVSHQGPPSQPGPDPGAPASQLQPSPPALGQLRAEPSASRGAVHTQTERGTRPTRPGEQAAPRCRASPTRPLLPPGRPRAAQHPTPACAPKPGPRHRSPAASGPMPALLGRGSPADPHCPLASPVSNCG